MQKATIIATLVMPLALLVGNSTVLAETETLEDVMTSEPAVAEEQTIENLEAEETTSDSEEAVADQEEAAADSDAVAQTMETEAASEGAEAVPVTGFGEGEVQESAIPKASDIREEIEQTVVKVYVNNPPSRYTLLKKLRSEVFVLDAKSEADAELLAFKRLKEKAKELGADGLIEVKRSIVKDSVAQLERPMVTGSMLGMDMDPTAIPVDELMLSNYLINKGTLSSRIIEDTFEASSDLSQKAIRFTGKAIKLDN